MKHILFVGFHWTEAFYLWYLSHLTSSGERNTGFLVKQRSQYSTLCDEPKMKGTHCLTVWYQSPNRRQDNEKGDHYKEAPGAGPEDVGPLYPVTPAQPPRAPHRLSVPAIVESLSTHRFIEQQRARNAAKNLVSSISVL